jgi:hypothetical protein
MNWFIDHLCTRLVSTSNYRATANLHDSQITTAPPKHFPASCVFTSRSLTTASSASRPHIVTLRRISRDSNLFFTASCSKLPINWLYPLFITFQHGRQKTPLFHCYSSTVALLQFRCLAMGMCLTSRFLETLWYTHLSHDHCIATTIHTTILLCWISTFKRLNKKLGSYRPC